jgi:hypothetical protein
MMRLIEVVGDFTHERCGASKEAGREECLQKVDVMKTRDPERLIAIVLIMSCSLHRCLFGLVWVVVIFVE